MKSRVNRKAKVLSVAETCAGKQPTAAAGSRFRQAACSQSNEHIGSVHEKQKYMPKSRRKLQLNGEHSPANKELSMVREAVFRRLFAGTLQSLPVASRTGAEDKAILFLGSGGITVKSRCRDFQKV